MIWTPFLDLKMLIHQQKNTCLSSKRSRISKKLGALLSFGSSNDHHKICCSCGRPPHHQQQWRIKLKSQRSIPQKQNMTQNHCEPRNHKRKDLTICSTILVVPLFLISNGFSHGNVTGCQMVSPPAVSAEAEFVVRYLQPILEYTNVHGLVLE